MILIISDTHCSFDTVNDQITFAETVSHTRISSVIHLGDFGFFKEQLHDFFIKRRQRFLRPLYCLEGNHEDFDSLPELVEKYRDCFTHLPRSAVTAIDGYNFLSLGGAAYMDAMITPPGALITDSHINACLAHPPASVDIILTHDCPVGIGVGNTQGMEHFGAPGFPRSNELADKFTPPLWLFGHHHQWFHTTLNATAYYGVNKIWNGFMLLGENYYIDIVKHRITYKRASLIDRILSALKIIPVL